MRIYTFTFYVNAYNLLGRKHNISFLKFTVDHEMWTKINLRNILEMIHLSTAPQFLKFQSSVKLHPSPTPERKILSYFIKFTHRDFDWLITSAAFPTVFLFRNNCAILYKWYFYKLYTDLLSTPSCREVCIFWHIHMRPTNLLLVI